MVRKLFTVFLLVLFSLTAYAGDRYLVRIGTDGKQEAIPLKKGEKASDVISRLENAKTSPMSANNAAGLIDTLRYYKGDASLTVNFGWTHQDVAFQWYVPEAAGVAKEFWWRNYNARGNINKGTIRAWIANSRLTTLPATAFDGAGRMGYYKKTDDGDGLVTPFKAEATDPIFYPGNGSDSAKVNFDPLGTEAAWLPGGLQVTLDSNKWQGVKMDDWGDSLKFKIGQLFGYTLMNDTKVSDIGGGTDVRLEISSMSAEGAPYHSIKFYEIRTAAANTPGWQVRSYEWGMYVVVEYTGDRAPKIAPKAYGSTLKLTPRTISAIITDDNPGGGAAGVASARLKYKKGALASYDSVAMTAVGTTYSGNTSSAAPNDTVYWFIVATDVNGNRATTSIRTYKIFLKTQSRLLIYNNAQYSLGNARLIYTSSSTSYDIWSMPSDGNTELADLLALYNNVLVADGAFPNKLISNELKAWLATGTATIKKALFFTSQDYGCLVDADCADITFAAGTFEFDYLGVSKIGPQDLTPYTRPFKVVPQADVVTNYLIKYNTDSATTLWHFPTFELGFTGYPDAVTPAAGTISLFKDGAGTNVVGVRKAGTGFHTMYLAFDAGALQFRSDTALTPGSTGTDKKYRWIVNVGSLSNEFFSKLTSVQPVNEVVPGTFSLGQNYPNPFNPTTVIEYNVPVQSNVEISIYNVLGQKIATLINDVHTAGTHRATWSGKDNLGKPVATGIYFYQMRAGSFEQVKKMMLMK